ncbi:DNA polymerase theta [Aphidius gifuensis]|uniref:DNA polymerase theta n=1 Tax=Aphidius gifuensis TaxID=684658 RepID=UPI001CDB94C1|nr:DNA polymerase theta [Aphidius gifuensis]
MITQSQYGSDVGVDIVDDDDDEQINVDYTTKTSHIQELIKSSLSYEVPSQISTQERLKLSNWGLPLTVLRKYEERGVTSMFPWQVECLSNSNIIDRAKNLVYSAPTSAGKTLVSEILIIKTVLERRKKVIFILPFVSVVREKMYYFKDLLSDAEVKVEGFMGGIQPPGGFNATDVAIATIEKANSLINQMMEEGGLENLGAVVIDELHLLSDPYRGYLLELLLTKLKYMTLKEENINIQLIGMSATLPNLDLLAKWLDAELYKTDFRPIPLKEYCKIGTTIYDDKLNSHRVIKPLQELNNDNDSDNIIQLCLETILEGHSVLIFCPTKNWTESLAQQLSSVISQLGRQNNELGIALRKQLNTETIMETLEQLKRSPVGLDSVLNKTVSFGVAFHHAGLTMDERDIVEGAFRSGSLKILTATSTLSSGVNLPARRVLIRTIMYHGKPIDTLTYKQMIGRAGRMGKDSAGESIIICKQNERIFLKKLLQSNLEPIKSCLNSTGPLIRALLEAVASEVAYTIDDINLYMKCTLLYLTNNQEINNLTIDAVDFLVKNEFFLNQKSINGNDERWIATQLGKASLAASVPPKDALFLFEELLKARRTFVLDTELHIIYTVTPINSSNNIGDINWLNFFDLWKSMSDSDKRVGQHVGVSEKFIANGISGTIKNSKLLDIHKRFYTSLILNDLVKEIPLSIVCKKYSCCRGVVQSLQQSAATFAGMVTQFCKKLGWDCVELLVNQFQQRLQFGVSRELLDLLRLPMLNGIRARSLFKEGIKSVAELAVADDMDVERALYKALPFESEKDYNNEHEYDLVKRNKMRSVFVTGKDGLTPREAAVMLVKEARELVKNELGVDEVDWNKKNKNHLTGQTCTNHLQISTKNTDILRQDSSTSYSSTVSINSGSSKISIEDDDDDKNVQQSLSLIEEDEENDHNIVDDDDEDDEQKADKIEENIPEIVEKQSSIESFGESLKFDSRMENLSTPKSILLKETFNSISDSRSPSLFGDSLILDTQDCNMLDENILEHNVLDENIIDPNLLDINVADFEENEFSCLQSSSNNNNNKQDKEKDVINFVKPTTPNVQLKNLDEKDKSKSLYWADDSWNLTNGILNALDQQVQQNNKTHIDNKKPASTLNTETNNKLDNVKSTSSNDTSKEADKKSLKRKSSSPIITDKSPLASVVKYDAAKRLSTDSNTSEDDVVVGTQAMDVSNTSNKISRTRLKLEALRIRTQKTTELIKTPLPSKTSTTFTVSLDDNVDDDDDDLFAESIIPNSEDEDASPKKKKIKKTTSKIHEKLLKKNNKSMNSMNLKELVVISVSEIEKFNDFKNELLKINEISMALACESFVKDTICIGTRIISTINSKDHERKIKKIDNCIYNDRKLCGVAITWGKNVYYMSFENIQEPNRVSIKDRMSLLTDILTNDNLTVRCFSSKEIYKTLFNCCNISSTCKFIDPTVADWLINPDLPDKIFGNLISEYLPDGLELYERLGSISGYFGPGLYVKSKISGSIRACTETALTWCTTNVLLKKLQYKNSQLLNTYLNIEMKIVMILSRMELTGFGINLPALQELSTVIKQQLAQIENQAYTYAGKKFNFSSSKAVAQVLGLTNDNNKKKISTNKVSLEMCDNPIANLITNWRKLHSTWIKMVCPLLNLAEKNSRIHGNCLTNTVTGRVSMHEPNLQNVPRDFNSADDTFVISVRMAFVPAIGNIMLSADYCQLELRILAHLSKEPILCRVFKKPGDVFKNISAHWYNCAIDDVDETMRQRTKQLCYAMIYGMGIKSLAETLKIEEDEAKEFQDKFMSTYPGLKKWINKTLDEAKKKGYITTLMGRRRYLPGLNSDINGEKKHAERQAINTMVQGSAADIAKKAMVVIDERMRDEYSDMPMVLVDYPVKRKLRKSKDLIPRGGYLVLQLHDELIYEVNGHDLENVARIIKESMENCCQLSVPLPVKVKVGPAWGDLQEYKF